MKAWKRQVDPDAWIDHRSLSPEIRLMTAVIERAIYDVLKGPLPRQRSCARDEATEAAEWIFSPDVDEWSFLWLCDCVDADPTSIRSKLFSNSYLTRPFGSENVLKLNPKLHRVCYC